MEYPPIKRCLDFSFALVLLLALSPLLALLAAVLLGAQGRPVFYLQERPGLHERPFKIIKFRTLEVTAGGTTSYQESQRATPLGRLLRLWSIDELPQLVNIIRGEMSFVGPRPLLTDYLPSYNSRQRLRHRVRPGLTGLAQIEGRNFVPWSRRLELDSQYVNRLSFSLDALIILRTIAIVLQRKGIAEANSQHDSRFDSVWPDD